MAATFLLFVFGDLGDTILTVPAIRALRRRYPLARLVLLAKPVAASFVNDLGLVDDIILIEKHAFDRVISLLNPFGLWSLWRMVHRIRQERADTVVLFHHLVTRWGALKFALLALCSGAPRRAGLDNGRGWFLTDRVTDRGFGARHESEYYLAVAGLLDAAGEPILEASISAEDEARADRLLSADAQGSRPLIAIHPGTGWYGPGRRWPAERFAAAAQLVAKRRPMHFILVGTEQDREAADSVSRLLPRPFTDLVGKTSIGELAAVLRLCNVLVANDGGVGHLAAAVATPVVSIFGPSNDRAWKPLTATVVAANLPCRPCFYRDYERGLPRGCATRECLEQVTPDMVADRILQVLSPRVLAV